MQKSKWGTRWVMAAGILVLAACSTSSGGAKVDMKTSDLDPAATGEIKYSVGTNQNMKVELQVRHMPEPQRIDPAAQSYVVWLQPKGENTQPQNAGVLRPDKDENAHLQTVTPYHEFNIFVTPEPSSTVQSPSGPTVLSASVPS
jgi:hypothetical protein